MVFKKLERIVYSEIKPRANENPGDSRQHFQWDDDVKLRKKLETSKMNKRNVHPASYITESASQYLSDEAPKSAQASSHLRTIKSFSTFPVDLHSGNPEFEAVPMPLEGIPRPFSHKRAQSAPSRWPVYYQTYSK
jgi:hypothetical protein